MHPGQGQSYSADERSEVQPEFTTIGDLVVGGGRVMWRVAGGENVGGAPAAAGGDVTAPAGGDGGTEGQGGGLGLYDLTEVPEHLRGVVEPELKKIEANVTKRFEEAAAFRKQWEPLSEIEGLSELQPEALTELLEFHRDVLSQGPEALKEWWTQIGEHAGWTQDVSGGDGDEEDDDLGGGNDPEVSQLRETVEQLASTVEQLVQGQQVGEQTQRKEAAKQAITQELDALAGEDLGEGQKFDDETRDAILTFALRYPGDEQAVRKGYTDLKKVRGQAVSSVVDDKLDQPGAALRGGAPNTEPEAVTSFAQAREAAKARRLASVGT